MANSIATTELPQLADLIQKLSPPITRIEDAALGEDMTEHMRASGLLGVFPA